MYMFPSIQIPDIILKNREITNWLCLKKTHIIFRAVHKQTEEVKIFQIISKHSFSEQVWKRLSRIRSDYLLLPDSQKKIKNAYLLSYSPVTQLNQIIQKDGMNVKMILQLLLDISKALQKLHQSGILHMDISPGNIYLSEHGHFMLGDFSESILSKSILTQKPKFTPGYAAPEYLEGNPVEASDQYSLAMLAYVLFNDGFLPSEQHTLPEPSIVQSDREIGQEIFSVIQRSLLSDPGLRYEDLSVFRETIQNLLSHTSDVNSYCLHITDTNHSFFQLSTEQSVDISPSEQKGKFFMIPVFLLLLISILLSAIHLADKQKPKRTSFTETTPIKQTDNKFPTEATPANIGANFSNELDFADRNLSSLTEVIAECDNPSLLQTIYGENNQLKSVEELQLFPSLQELYLSNNQIQNTDSFQELSNLSVLILSDNSCIDLTGLSALQQLNFLDLSGNRELSDISPLAACQNLNTLILSDTAVTEFSIEQLQAELPECQILY